MLLFTGGAENALCLQKGANITQTFYRTQSRIFKEGTEKMFAQDHLRSQKQSWE